MPTRVPLSLGKIVDKYTILTIKIDKTKDESYKKQLMKEKDVLQNYIKKDEKFNKLLNDLSTINKRIWTLKDLLTNSMHKFKDPESSKIGMHYYSMLCELFNCEKSREHYKKSINECYDKDCITKYIFNSLKTNTKNEELYDIDHADKIQFDLGQKYSGKGNYREAYNIFEKLAKKYENETFINKFIILIYVINASICQCLGESFKYMKKFEWYLNHPLLSSHMNDQEIENVRYNYAFEFLLPKGKYIEAKKYAYKGQRVLVDPLNIRPDTMKYFNKNDEDKILLIYCSGGLGDKIMHSRLIPIVCEEAEKRNNKVLFLVDDCLSWLFDCMYDHISNLTIIEMEYRDNLPHFDYHINLTVLFMYMGYTSETLPPPYYIPNNTPDGLQSDELIEICQPIFAKKKKNVVFNWHGNFTNHHEVLNRGSKLLDWIPLFKNCDVNWIAIQPAFTDEEKEIMEAHNVINVGPLIDKNGDAFRDTIELMRHADLCITTDTSIAHIGASLNINIYILLTIGCAWMWSSDKKQDWYPNANLLRQKELQSWKGEINELEKIVNEL